VGPGVAVSRRPGGRGRTLATPTCSGSARRRWSVATAFQEDLREVRFRDIRRFPTLVSRAGDGPGIAIVGYRPYDVLRAALAQLCPGLGPTAAAADPG
jgi:hypothetical protein